MEMPLPLSQLLQYLTDELDAKRGSAC